MQYNMIKFISRVILTILVLIPICIVSAAEPGDEVDGEQDTLKVEIVDKPASCKTSSQRGHVLKVHYTGYLVDGQKFDSRLVSSSVVRYPRYLDTYRWYLRDDTSIANVTIYRGIS